MNPADRLRGWIESLSEAWKDRVWGWLRAWAVGSITDALEDITPEQKAALDIASKRIIDDPDIPADLKALFETAGMKGNPLLNFVKYWIMGYWLIELIGKMVAPEGTKIGFARQRQFEPYRLDPISLITAWRRDPEAYEKYFGDLKDQGWSDDRIEALKFFTLFMPSAQDLVNWQAKEVFEPDMIAKYGLDDEFEGLDLTLFGKIGVTEEQARNFWRAHWEHPELRTIIEMLRRTDFTEADMAAWFRLVEIPPYWRDKLIQISYEVPTRVDVRRWWDMRTIDEARLREIYAHQGYHGKDLDDYVLWTKVYVAFPDLIARWKNGWISIDEVRAELIGYGMPAQRVEELLETKFKSTEGDRVTGERDVTKTDIIKGVKKAVITRGEGMELLMDLGYDEDEADYILTINIPIDEEDVAVNQRDLTKTDILKGLKAAIITEDEALERLKEIRYSQLDAEFLLKIYRALVEPPTEPRAREASKADIVLAVKKGLITPEDGYLMLQDIGFTPEAAQFILVVKAEVSPFSPMSYQEFKDTTGKWRKAAGMTSETITEQIRQAAGEVVKLTKDLEILQTLVREEEAKLVKEEVLPAETTARRDELRVALHRAESTLFTAQSHYNALVAEWRHKA